MYKNWLTGSNEVNAAYHILATVQEMWYLTSEQTAYKIYSKIENKSSPKENIQVILATLTVLFYNFT